MLAIIIKKFKRADKALSCMLPEYFSGIKSSYYVSLHMTLSIYHNPHRNQPIYKYYTELIKVSQLFLFFFFQLRLNFGENGIKQ